MNAIGFLSGKKTYLTGLLALLLVFGSWQGWWTVPNQAYEALMALALIFLRAGVAKQPPVTPDPDAAAVKPASLKMPMLMLAFCFWVCVSAIISGCAPLQPGADPLVVRTEQTLTSGKATFDLVLAVDDSNRTFWRTNAPGFHNFVEWLRQPQAVQLPNSTTNLPRCYAMLWQLDEIKSDYQASRASSNAVIEALTTLQSTLQQATAWEAVITDTNKP